MLPDRFIPLLILLTLLLSACSRQPEIHNQRLLVFGTIIDISIVGVDKNTANNAFKIIEDDFKYMHEAWHAWQPGALGRINNLLPTTASFTIAPSMLPVIQKATALSDQSNHLFNPAIGNLIRAWGFHSNDLPTKLPDQKTIHELVKQNPTMDDLELNGITMRSRNSAMLLDMGAFAKGYGIDVGIENLRKLGIDNAIINAGGDLRAIGKKGDRNWRIGVRHPRNNSILASIEMQGDESIFTSGDYERFFDHEGKRYHHIIDPRTGYPADKTTSVTVIHSDGATADAAATALFIAGPEQWHAIARQMNIKYVMLIDKHGHIHMNPAMQKRIRFVTDTQPEITISEPL